MNQPAPQKNEDTKFGKLVLRVFELLSPKAAITTKTELVQREGEKSVTETAPEVDREDTKQLNEIRHKSYLDLRGKTESTGASARLEMDKSILTLSSAGLALTLGMYDHFHFMVWQAIIIILLFISAIVTTLQSMRFTEKSADKFVEVIDKAYDASVEEKTGELPLTRVINESDPETKEILTNSGIILEQLNNWAFGLFIAAIVALIIFAMVQSAVPQINDGNKMTEKKVQVQTTKEDKGQKLPSVPRPMPKPNPEPAPKTKTTK